ncbi:MAG: hypothetical protein NTW96_11295 [Planctomycetia bacterium]|nr:hypothetical protein [Planctomycetia bacterium]
MKSPARRSQMLLTLGFLAVIAGVPAAQIAIELRRGEPVQSTDVFRCPPTAENLRRFEHALEDGWWGQETLRPRMQQFLLATLGDTGAKALAGREDWLFYRPGVRYLVEPNRAERDDGGSIWVQPPSGETRRDSVVAAIVRFRDQLAQRGIQLLVVPIPGKASVYPDMLSRRAEGTWRDFRSPTEELLEELERRGVNAVDLFAVFREARQAAASDPALYLASDTHWTPAGAKVAADAVAQRLRQLDWLPEHPYKYAGRTVRVRRSGDLPGMMQAPGAREWFPAEIVECRQVLDPLHGGLLVPAAGGREGTYMNEHLVDTPMEASLLVLGDSFSRIYQFAEPASLGEVDGPTTSEPSQSEPPDDRPSREAATAKRRLLPGSAGFPSLLADALGAAVDYIVSDGGAATDVRRRLSVNPAILERKRVVIWEFAERDVALGKEGWRDVPLPSAPNQSM